MRQTIRAALLVASLALLTSCAGWEPQKRLDALAAVDTMESSQVITPAQAAALREAIEELADGTTGADIAEWLGAVLAAVLASVLGVRGMRGPAKPLPKADAAILATLVEAAKKNGSA